EGLTTAFASGLDFETVVEGALRRVPAALILGVAGLARIASAEGRAVGAAFGEGFAGGLTVSNHDVSTAAGALATTADEAIRRRLGIKSPSSVGQDIGVQFVAGIAQGLAELSPVHQATAALKLALVPNIKDLAQQTV